MSTGPDVIFDEDLAAGCADGSRPLQGHVGSAGSGAVGAEDHSASLVEEEDEEEDEDEDEKEDEDEGEEEDDEEERKNGTLIPYKASGVASNCATRASKRPAAPPSSTR